AELLQIVSRCAGVPVSRCAGVPVSRCEILDIGSGCGCIAVSLAKFLPYAKVTAVDISPAALEVAKQNSIQNNVKVNFIKSDLFNTRHLKPNTYHLIVTNPPYIKTDEISRLEPEISYEPQIALDAGVDGLDFYRRIIGKAPCYLKEGGILIMEMGFGQVGGIKNIFQESGRFKVLEIVKDYNNIERIIAAQLQ
ncbi:MAG: HemK/PrmC family methyltransferase, partial [Candidatus Omnitrophota bacterium]|nr:HemK/PrmC family methyltransferase [Candidatus Omnitrophota bacterium]